MVIQIFYSILFLAYNVLGYELEGFFPSQKSSIVTNITTSIGKTIILNCSWNNPDFLKIRSLKSTTSFLRLKPTWFKADAAYEHNGVFKGYKTEKLIVTRKGIILENYRNKIKLSTNSNNDQFIKISDVDISDEGKYICSEFSSQLDQIYFVNIQCNFKNFN